MASLFDGSISFLRGDRDPYQLLLYRNVQQPNINMYAYFTPLNEEDSCVMSIRLRPHRSREAQEVNAALVLNVQLCRGDANWFEVLVAVNGVYTITWPNEYFIRLHGREPVYLEKQEQLSVRYVRP